MESSDESFLWTDASNDYTSDSNMARDENCDIESESGYSYKKKLQKKLFNNNEQSILEEGSMKKSKKRKHNHIDSTDFDEPKKKHIKSEPESDIDKQYKKSKSQILHSDNTLNDEDFLNYKVKEEQMSNEIQSPKVKKKKKKKDRESNGSNGDEPDSNSIHQNANISDFINGHYDVKEEQDTESKRQKKKKNKKKINKECDQNSIIEEENVIGQTVQDDNTMDSTILDKLCKMEDKEQISSNNNVSLENSHSFVENNDEGEISKINSSYLNTTTVKHINSALSQNGGNNDMMLSCGGKIPKTLTISDRITFEDEETSEFDNDSQIYKKNDTKYSSQFKKYFKANEHLKEVSTSISSNCVISEDDEIWVLECPSDIDVKNLKNSSLVIDTKCKLKVESQTYVGFSESNTDTMTILTIGGGKPLIKNVPLSGLIHLHKRVPKPHFVEDNNVINNQTNFIPLPDTKCRHPLFGVNYKNAIKVPKHVAERLHGLESEFIREHMDDKSKKLKKKRKIKTNLSDMDDEAKGEREIKPKKKKRKRSRDSATPPKSAKRPKRESDSAATWDSEKAIEQQLFNF